MRGIHFAGLTFVADLATAACLPRNEVTGPMDAGHIQPAIALTPEESSASVSSWKLAWSSINNSTHSSTASTSVIATPYQSYTTSWADKARYGVDHYPAVAVAAANTRFPSGSSGQDHVRRPWQQSSDTTSSGQTSVTSLASAPIKTSITSVSAIPVPRSIQSRAECTGKAMWEMEYVSTCFSGETFYMPSYDCMIPCNCVDRGTNRVTSQMDYANTCAVRAFYERLKPGFQCGGPNTAKRDGDSQDVPPSAPLRPTSDSYTTVTSAPFSPPLRPMSAPTMTHTTIVTLAQRNEPSYNAACNTAYYVTLVKYSVACADGTRVIQTIQKDCNEKCDCDCDSRGNLQCHGRACRKDVDFASFCKSTSGGPQFCGCTHTPVKIEVRNNDNAAEFLSEAKALDARLHIVVKIDSEVSTTELLTLANDISSSSAAKYRLYCSGSSVEGKNFAEVCNNGFVSPISGERCRKWCHCDSKGHMSCDSPTKGYPEPSTAITNSCSSKMSNFTYKCAKKAQDIRAPTLLEASQQSSPIPRDVNSVTCNGADMTTVTDTGVVCMDGITLRWSDETCTQYCDCNDDTIACHRSSDCGPVKDVNAFCTVGSTFACQCPRKAIRHEIEAAAPALPENGIDTREPIAEQQNSMTCTGSDMDTRFDTGVLCMDGNSLHWSGDTCAQYCSCSDGQIHCDAPSDCGPEDDLSIWCAVGPNYKFICDCSVEERGVSVTTKKSATTTQPMPKLSFPATLTNLPRFVPPIAALAVSQLPSAAAIQSTPAASALTHSLQSVTLSYTSYLPATCSTGNGFCEHTATSVVEFNSWTGPATMYEVVSVPALQARNYFAFKCSGLGTLKTINIGDTGQLPNEIAIYLNENYCQAYCGCDEDGCITCSTGGAPMGINEFGGGRSATKFCADNHKEFRCDCYDKKGARGGCQH